MMERTIWLDDLKRHEGWRPSVYDDATGQPIVPKTTVIGHPTVGYGFCLDASLGCGIPNEVAEYWLDYLINDICNWLTEQYPWWTDAPAGVRRALVNMAYQMGPNRLRTFDNMLKAMEACDYETAHREALDSEWASPRQTPERAAEVASWMLADRENVE